ncbi:MAG: pseudouridine synthase [Ignavibacteriae bacterium]|nr:pseudouridine synthase [Ignavibacteriota bacterium]MCB9214826.1 pseudouridine synthase [Ignavibacteria bacterium]
MPHLLLFNKPYHVLSQFTDSEGRETLADYIQIPNVYAAGRLDYDSEGLLLLTDQGWLQKLVADPRHKLPKTYLVQVEGIPTPEVLQNLERGVELKEGLTRPAKGAIISPPEIWLRTPPIRERKNVPTSWLRLTIREGRNRQVRRMTGAVGFPTLRLIRQKIGPWRLGKLPSGEWVELPCPNDEREFQKMIR